MDSVNLSIILLEVEDPGTSRDQLIESFVLSVTREKPAGPREGSLQDDPQH